MAYRMLRAMTLVALGALAVGCGSGPGAAYVVEDDEMPESADAPPPSEDAPPASADDALPANPDAPGAGTRPGGNTPHAVCSELCALIDGPNCVEPPGAIGMVLATGCSQGCILNDAQKQCEQEIDRLLRCVSRIDGLCTDEVSEDSCRNELDAVGACQMPDTPGPNNPDEPDCSNLTDACELCMCAATTQEAAMACQAIPNCM